MVVTAMVTAVSAGAFTYNGDLLVGFTKQSGSDVIYDIGPASALYEGKQWNLNSALSGFNLNTVYWGVIGDKNLAGTRAAWNTTVGLSVSSTAAWGKLDTATKSIYQNFTVSGTEGDLFSILASDDNSWNSQTIVGSLATQFHNVYGDPNVQGTTSASFYSEVANNSAPTQLSNFALDSGGVLTYGVVPEPTSAALLGLGSLVILFRRSSKN